MERDGYFRLLYVDDDSSPHAFSKGTRDTGVRDGGAARKETDKLEISQQGVGEGEIQHVEVASLYKVRQPTRLYLVPEYPAMPL